MYDKKYNALLAIVFFSCVGSASLHSRGQHQYRDNAPIEKETHNNRNVKVDQFILENAPIVEKASALEGIVIEQSLLKTSTANVDLVKVEKPIPKEYVYVCAIGRLHGVPCDAIKNFPVNDIIRNRTLEMRMKQQAWESIEAHADYLINPRTHRIWLTSLLNPKEAPEEQLRYYNSSLQFYAGKPFKHYFWCNDKTLIPKTIQAISNFNVPVEVHELKEVAEKFVTRKLYEKFMQDEMFAFAGNLARQEIILQFGGLYADIGLEQLEDLEWFFKKYERVLCIHEPRVDIHFFAAAKGSKFFSQAISLIEPVVKSLEQSGISMPFYEVHGFIERRIWQFIEAIENKTLATEAFFYEGDDYRYHGMRSWMHLVKNVTVTYLMEGIQ